MGTKFCFFKLRERGEKGTIQEIRPYWCDTVFSTQSTCQINSDPVNSTVEDLVSLNVGYLCPRCTKPLRKACKVRVLWEGGLDEFSNCTIDRFQRNSRRRRVMDR